MATVDRAIPLKKESEQEITRFDSHQIAQHAGLMASFILLVLTGLPQKFHDAGISQWWVEVWGGIEVIRGIHHFAAYLIILVCIYHLIYLFYSTLILKRPFPIKMIPNRQDGTIIFHEISYFLGLRKDRPKFDRFNWREKFDYWAIFWGMPIIGFSGFILMYPVLVTKYLPGWVVPAALIAHSDEAMLALIWIFIVHVYFNHFTPGSFPLNKSIFTGKVSIERYRKDHPIEYEKLRENREEEKTP